MRLMVARLSVVVAVVVACCFPLGRCQGQNDTNRGCYYDGDGDSSQRVLMDLIHCKGVTGVCQQSCGPGEAYCESQGSMTVDNCRALCRDGNFQYYGVEGGNQCFCGGALSTPFVYGTIDTLTNCSDPCTGDSSQTCGGEFKIDIYEFQDPVQDPGCFFPGSVPFALVEDVGVGVGETLTFRCMPGYELVGDSDLVCRANRTWSSVALPSCNYTGVFPETTTEMPPTTTEMAPTTTELAPTTTLEGTTPNPTTVSTMANPATTKSRTSATTVKPVNTDKPAGTTKPQASSTTLKPVPTTNRQTAIRDILPYIIGVSAALVLLLVLCVISILAHTSRRRSGNAKRNISLKPDHLAPVTLMNRGYSPGDGDPESGIAMPDVLLAGTSGPQATENEYAGMHGARGGEDETDGEGEESKLKGAEQFWEHPDTYAEMKPLDAPPEPIYENGAASAAPPGQATSSGPAESEGSSIGASVDSTVPSTTTYENLKGGAKWDSQDTLVSDEGRAFFADPTTTSATKL